MKLTIILLLSTITLLATAQTTAVHYEDLQKVVLIDIEGFEPGEPDGQTINISGTSYSMANVKFTKGSDYIDISLMDYSQATSIYTATTMAWGLNMTLDSPDEKAGGVQITDQIKGWESYKKKSKDVSLTLGVKERYILVIEMNNQTDTEMAKTIAKKVKISDLP